MILITSPNSDLRNALIKKQPKIPPKIDEETTKKSSKISAKFQHRFQDRFSSILEHFFNNFGTNFGGFLDKFVVMWCLLANLCSFSWIFFGPFWDLWNLRGRFGPILAPSRPTACVKVVLGESLMNFGPIWVPFGTNFGPKNDRKPS